MFWLEAGVVVTWWWRRRGGGGGRGARARWGHWQGGRAATQVQGYLATPRGAAYMRRTSKRTSNYTTYSYLFQSDTSFSLHRDLYKHLFHIV